MLEIESTVAVMGEGNGTPLQCSCLENPGDGEPGGLPSMGSHRVGHDWSDVAAAVAAMKNTFDGAISKAEPEKRISEAENAFLEVT